MMEYNCPQPRGEGKTHCVSGRHPGLIKTLSSPPDEISDSKQRRAASFRPATNPVLAIWSAVVGREQCVSATYSAPMISQLPLSRSRGDAYPVLTRNQPKSISQIAAPCSKVPTIKSHRFIIILVVEGEKGSSRRIHVWRIDNCYLNIW